MSRMSRYAVVGVGDKRSRATAIISRFQFLTLRGVLSQHFLRRAFSYRTKLLPSINLTILLLSLIVFGNSVSADTEESALYVDLGSVYKQDGLEPLNTWIPGTGYSTFDLSEPMAIIVPTLLQDPNSCLQTSTVTFPNRVSCTFTYTGGAPSNTGIVFIDFPSGGDVTKVVTFVISIPLLVSCSNGNSEITYGWCGAAIRRKVHNIPDQQCPIALEPLSNDPCTQSLEAIPRGEDNAGACPELTNEMQQQAQCLADKITSLGIPYSKPTSTIRTAAYQAHLRDIWNKLRKLDKLDDPAVRQACTSRKAEIEDHKKSHGLTDEPATSSQHEIGKAVDVGKNVIRELINRASTDTSDIQSYVNSSISNPPACNLQWGGRFQQPDTVHFQLP